MLAGKLDFSPQPTSDSSQPEIETENQQDYGRTKMAQMINNKIKSPKLNGQEQPSFEEIEQNFLGAPDNWIATNEKVDEKQLKIELPQFGTLIKQRYGGF